MNVCEEQAHFVRRGSDRGTGLSHDSARRRFGALEHVVDVGLGTVHDGEQLGGRRRYRRGRRLNGVDNQQAPIWTRRISRPVTWSCKETRTRPKVPCNLPPCNVNSSGLFTVLVRWALLELEEL